MKNQFSRNFAWFSAMLFLGFLSLYVYVWIENPNPKPSSAGMQWSCISFGHVMKPLVRPNGLPTGTYIYDDNGPRVAVTKEFGGSFVFFNQAIPFFGGTIGFADTKAVDEKGWDVYGIYFRVVKDNNRADSWWTFIISFWYPLIIFSIWPILFMVRRLRSMSSST